MAHPVMISMISEGWQRPVTPREVSFQNLGLVAGVSINPENLNRDPCLVVPVQPRDHHGCKSLIRRNAFESFPVFVKHIDARVCGRARIGFVEAPSPLVFWEISECWVGVGHVQTAERPG